MLARLSRPRVMRTWSTVEELNYQRRGERGVDYDEYGAEMEPNARVWGVYVDETDKADRELVDGWNGSMDVMLIFAALFSAILTAFVLESSKDLKPDYSEISARALLIIAGTSPTTGSPSASQIDPSSFEPTQAAVVVNTLWFLSLGLSIAVTLIAILAKEWCYSFMSRRTGAKLTQARLRQKRWDGIRQWKMEEIISLLPLLMHIALLLFAIGLVIYLWDINISVALPVLITTILTALYYIVTAFLPLFYKYCPYTTAVVKLFHPLWTVVFGSIYSRALFQLLIMTPAFLLLSILDFKDRVFGKKSGSDSPVPDNPQTPNDGTQDDKRSMESRDTLHAHVQELEKKFYHRIEKMHKDFSIDVSEYSEDETPMDKATSAMLLWMITNCEDPKSVDLALQALAGADLWLPVEAFSKHEIDFQVLRKLERCLYVLESPHLKNDDAAWEQLLDNAHLYSRALATLLRGAPEKPKIQGVTWNEWGSCMRRLHKILHDNTYSSNHARLSQSTDFEFGALLLEGLQAKLPPGTEDFYTKRRERRWEVLEQITTNQVTGIPPSASSVRSLVNVIARTLVYSPRSPLPLVELFNAYNNAPGTEDPTLAHSIGIALTVSRFTDPRFDRIPFEANKRLNSASERSLGNTTSLTRQEHAQIIYNKLATKQPTQRRTQALLTFGLLGLLDYPTAGQPFLEPDEIKSIGKALQIIETPDPRTQHRKSTLLTREDQSMRYLGYHSLMPMIPPKFELESQFKSLALIWLKLIGASSPTGPYSPPSPNQDTVIMYLEALLSPSLCQLFGIMIINYLVDLIMPSKENRGSTNQGTVPPESVSSVRRKVELSQRGKKLCIRSITHSITDWPGSSDLHKEGLNSVVHKLKEVGFRTEMVSLIKKHQPNEKGGESDGEKSKEKEKEVETDRNLVPYAMNFLWNLTITRTGHSLSQENRTDHRANSTNNRGTPSKSKKAPWKCVRDSPFERQWFDLLWDLYEEDYENVLESGILDELAKPCEDKCYQTKEPVHRANPEALTLLGLPEFHEGIPTVWLDVYKQFRETCLQKREQKRERERLEREKEAGKQRENSVAERQPLAIETKRKRASTDKSDILVLSPRSEPDQPIASGSRSPAITEV